MANPFIRVDLSDKARDYRPVAIEPGKPLLDPTGSRAKLVFRWLGGLAAEPVMENDWVSFYVCDDYGGRLENIVCYPVSRDDLQGQLKQEVAKLRERLDKARPETPSEQAVRNTLHRVLQELLDDPNRSDLDSYFFRYCDMDGQWRLVWCWGYDRIDKEPAPAVICRQANCNLLFRHRRGQSLKCPCCQSSVITRPQRKSPRRTIAAVLLLLVVIAAGAAWYLMHYPRLVVRPDTWNPKIGDQMPIDGSGSHKVVKDWLFFKDKDVASDATSIASEDPQIVQWDPKQRVLSALQPGRTSVRVELPKFKPGTLDVAVQAPQRLVVEPQTMTLKPDESANLEVFKVHGLYEDGKRVDLGGQVEWTAANQKIASIDGDRLLAIGLGDTQLTASYRPGGLREPLLAAVDVRVIEAQKPEVPGPPQEKLKAVRIHSDQGLQVQLPVGGELGGIRVEAEYDVGGTRDVRDVTDKAILRSVDPPDKSPVAVYDGRLRGLEPGSGEVVAEFGDERSQQPLQVTVTENPQFDAIRLEPPHLTMRPGESLGLRVIGQKDEKDVATITDLARVSVESHNPKVAEVVGTTVWAQTQGQAQLVAKFGNLESQPAVVEVVAPDQPIQTKLTVMPESLALSLGQNVKLGIGLKVTAQRGADAPVDVSQLCTVESRQPAVVRYDQPNRALIAAGPGETVVWFGYAGQKAQASIKVEGPVPPEMVTHIMVEPSTEVLAVGHRLPLRVFAVTTDKRRVDRTSDATIASSDPQVVSTHKNFAEARKPGQVEITATLPGTDKSGKAWLRVTDEEIGDVYVVPLPSEVEPGKPYPLDMRAKSLTGTHLLSPNSPKFAKPRAGNGDDDAVRVDGNGNVILTERTEVAISSAGKSIRWKPELREPLYRLEVDPPELTLRVGESATFRAVRVLPGGDKPPVDVQQYQINPEPGQTEVKVVQGESGQPALHGLEPGKTRVTIEVSQPELYKGMSTTAAVNVESREEPGAKPPITRQITSIHIKPEKVTLKPGEQVRFTVTATTRDSGTFEVADAQLESLDRNVLEPEKGVFVAKVPGGTQVRATHAGLQAFAEVSVIGKPFGQVRTELDFRGPEFDVTLHIQTDGSQGDWEYRVYLPDQQPPDAWTLAQRENDVLKVTLKSPPIASKPSGTVYKLMVEARHKQSGRVENYPHSFELIVTVNKQVVQPRQ